MIVTYEYKIKQLMLKVTSCRADRLEKQCVRTHNTTHLGARTNLRNAAYDMFVRKLGTLRNTVIPKLTCETITKSKIVSVSPCYDGRTGLGDPILNMVDSEMVSTLDMVHW